MNYPTLASQPVKLANGNLPRQAAVLAEKYCCNWHNHVCVGTEVDLSTGLQVRWRPEGSRCRRLKPAGRNLIDCSVRTLISYDIRDHKETWCERHAVCPKCGNEAWQKGYTIGCAKSALIKLRHTCPRGENNFYFSSPLLREEAEERLALRNKDKRLIR